MSGLQCGLAFLVNTFCEKCSRVRIQRKSSVVQSSILCMGSAPNKNVLKSRMISDSTWGFKCAEVRYDKPEDDRKNTVRHVQKLLLFRVDIFLDLLKRGPNFPSLE